MPRVRFKLKKPNARINLVSFDWQPSWEDLASSISELYNIPPDRIGVAFFNNKAKEPDILTDEQQFQRFYKSLDPSEEPIKFVVQDLQTLDGESTFS